MTFENPEAVPAIEVRPEDWDRLMAGNVPALIRWQRILASDLTGDQKIRAVESLLIVEGVPYRRGPGYAG